MQPPATTKATAAPVVVTGDPVVNNATGTCLDLSASTGDLQLWQCRGTAGQRFSFPGDGTMRVLGRCVQVKGSDGGARLGAAACTGSDAQRFDLNEASDLVSLRSVLCVDVPDANAGNGIPAQVWECNGNSNQKWHRLPG